MAAIAVTLVSIWMDIFKDGTEIHCKRKISSSVACQVICLAPCGETFLVCCLPILCTSTSYCHYGHARAPCIGRPSRGVRGLEQPSIKHELDPSCPFHIKPLAARWLGLR
jgi:hypothetical protein